MIRKVPRGVCQGLDGIGHFNSAIPAVLFIFASRQSPIIEMDTNNYPSQQKPETTTHVIVCLITSIPVYWASLYYIEAATTRELEELAIAATISFFASVYAGRYLAQIWAPRKKNVPPLIMIILVLTITVNVIWLFVHADFPIEGRTAINLLLFWLPFVVLSLCIGLLVKFIRITMSYQLQQARVSAEHSRSELNLLQSQLSPHFLFNTLNNLYGISLTQPDKMPTLLLKLSELLRYSVYEVKELFVPLKDEIAYINNYIEFEKIRIGDRLELKTVIEDVTDHEATIAPMLLIVFIENGFKHSKNTPEQKIFVDITLKTWGNSILFSVKNSFNAAAQEKQTMEKSGGLGIANVRKRLDLLYANRYDLNVEEADGFYNVLLQLKYK
jgi:hypothetical protein